MYIYRAYDKNGREWHYLDSLGSDYFAKSQSKKRSKVSLSLSNESIQQVDKYRAPLGLSRSRYIDYVINEHFSVVANE